MEIYSCEKNGFNVFEYRYLLHFTIVVMFFAGSYAFLGVSFLHPMELMYLCSLKLDNISLSNYDETQY